jgi:hypothetical protein
MGSIKYDNSRAKYATLMTTSQFQSSSVREMLVGFTHLLDTKALRESRGKAVLCFMTSVEGGEGSALRPGCFLPPGKTRYPLYRRLGGPQDRS